MYIHTLHYFYTQMTNTHADSLLKKSISAANSAADDEETLLMHFFHSSQSGYTGFSTNSLTGQSHTHSTLSPQKNVSSVGTYMPHLHRLLFFNHTAPEVSLSPKEGSAAQTQHTHLFSLTVGIKDAILSALPVSPSLSLSFCAFFFPHRRVFSAISAELRFICIFCNSLRSTPFFTYTHTFTAVPNSLLLSPSISALPLYSAAPNSSSAEITSDFFFHLASNPLSPSRF